MSIRLSGALGRRTLPMERPTRFELTVNQKTAATLGGKFPSAILARADAVVE